MSILNVSEKTVKVFQDCGFDILGYFKKLNENMDVVLRVLQYHTDISNPKLSLEQRQKLSIEFFDFMEKDDADKRLHQFVQDMKLFDKELAQCVVSKDIEAAKEVFESVIPDISRLEKFITKHKQDLFSAMKWMYEVLHAYNPDLKLEEFHQQVCPECKKPNYMIFIVIIFILLGAILYLTQKKLI